MKVDEHAFLRAVAVLEHQIELRTPDVFEIVVHELHDLEQLLGVAAGLAHQCVDLLGRDVEIVMESTCVKRSEEHTSELQSLMRISYAVFCLRKKKNHTHSCKAHITSLSCTTLHFNTTTT